MNTSSKGENFGGLNGTSRITATPGGKFDAADDDRATLNLSDINEVKTKAESHTQSALMTQTSAASVHCALKALTTKH